MKYKVGDKVLIVSKWVPGCNQNYDGAMDKWLGKVMTIREAYGAYYRMKEDRAEFEGHGWAWYPAAIAGPAYPKQKIVVTTDGKTTTAKLFDGKQMVKSATAVCSSRDAFDFETGAALAVDRLLGREKKTEPENKFPHDKLVTGVFGHTSDGDWFVVVNGDLIYKNGQRDTLPSLDCEGRFSRYRIDCLVEAGSFNQARVRACDGKVLWALPGAKFD